MNKEQAGCLSFVAVNILLTAIFILVAVVLIMSLAAEIKFNHAQKLADG